MSNATDNNGGQPFTQTTRDTMAQSDHDKLVEYGVMLQNIMAGQLRLEQQIKDLIQGQATALASWEASSKAAHDTQDLRIRKLEDLATQYVPIANENVNKLNDHEIRIKSLESNRSFITGGWRTFLFIGAVIAGLAGLVISVINLFIKH